VTILYAMRNSLTVHGTPTNVIYYITVNVGAYSMKMFKMFSYAAKFLTCRYKAQNSLLFSKYWYRVSNLMQVFDDISHIA